MKVLSVLVFVFTSMVMLAAASGSSHAESSARAPVLDQPLKRAIEKMSSLNGKKIPALENRGLIITFFASWCPPCRPEFAELNSLREMFSPNDINIVAINLFESHFEDGAGIRMKRFLGESRPNFSVVHGKNDASIRQLFGDVDRIPTLYVYDRNGQPVYTFIHQQGATKTHLTAQEIAPHIQRLLNNPASK